MMMMQVVIDAASGVGGDHADGVDADDDTADGDGDNDMMKVLIVIMMQVLMMIQQVVWQEDMGMR